MTLDVTCKDGRLLFSSLLWRVNVLTSHPAQEGAGKGPHLGPRGDSWHQLEDCLWERLHLQELPQTPPHESGTLLPAWHQP